MPTIITRGLGYDEPTIVYKDVASALVGSVVVEDRLIGVVTVEEPPRARVAPSVSVFGTIIPQVAVFGQAVVQQRLLGVLKEEGPLMSLEVNKITMFIRDDRTLAVSVNEDTGGPVNLTGAKLWFTVKARATDDDDHALIRKRNTAAGGGDDEIEVTDAAGGKAEIYIVPDDTLSFDPGTYLYDIQVQLANGKTYTITRDKITFKEDVTKTAS